LLPLWRLQLLLLAWVCTVARRWPALHALLLPPPLLAALVKQPEGHHLGLRSCS
jgi:hypothetical protein